MTSRIHLNSHDDLGRSTVIDSMLDELRPDEPVRGVFAREAPAGDVAEKPPHKPPTAEERRVGSPKEQEDRAKWFADLPPLPTHRPDFTRPRGRR